MEAIYAVQELNYNDAYPRSFKAALEHKIPDILAAAGPGESLTSQQIAVQLPRKADDDAQKLGRILRLLAHKGIFTASDSEPTRYGLTEVSKYFVTNSEFDLTPYVMVMQRREMLATYHHLREAVEEDADAFALANGTEFWTYASLNPDFNEELNAAMRSRSHLLNRVIARGYEGFKDVHCLVDVGGGVGGALTVIVAEHPHIRGRNFDLPHVIATAPSIPGVEHVPGSFWEFVPSGDAMLLQDFLREGVKSGSIKLLHFNT